MSYKGGAIVERIGRVIFVNLELLLEMISNFSGTLIPKSINPFNNPTEVSSSVTIAAVTPAL